MSEHNQAEHTDERTGAGRNGDAARDDGRASRRGTSFDPTPHVRQLRGRGGNGEYLDVKWSLVWLRREHPDAQIVTEHIQIDDAMAIFKATVTLPTGAIATGYGSETTADFRDYIEKAETKAIGRALRALGFGAPNNEGEDEIETMPAPASLPPARQRPAPVEPAPPAAPERTAAAPDRATAPDRSAASAERAPAARPAPASSRSRAAGDAPSAAPKPASGPKPAAPPAAPAGDDPDLADYSWSAFWPWARGLGLPDKKAIEDLIGRSTDGLPPAELRALVLTARGEG